MKSLSRFVVAFVWTLVFLGTLAGIGVTLACLSDPSAAILAEYALGDGGADATTVPGAGDILQCSALLSCSEAGVIYADGSLAIPFQPQSQQDGGWSQEIFVAGDSIAGGYAASYAFPTVAQILLGQGTKVRFVSKPGQTCLQVAQQAIYDAAYPTPTGVTGRKIGAVMCGTNNRKDAVDADPSDMIGETRDIVSYYRDAGFDPVWVMIPPQWTGFTQSNWKPMHDALVDAAATGADRIITLDGTPLVLVQDAGDSTWINMDQINDRLHPTNDGQTLIGLILAKELLH